MSTIQAFNSNCCACMGSCNHTGEHMYCGAHDWVRKDFIPPQSESPKETAPPKQIVSIDESLAQALLVNDKEVVSLLGQLLVEIRELRKDLDKAAKSDDATRFLRDVHRIAKVAKDY